MFFITEIETVNSNGSINDEVEENSDVVDDSDNDPNYVPVSFEKSKFFIIVYIFICLLFWQKL